jgi:cytochrome c-type biogenesis protein CcmH
MGWFILFLLIAAAAAGLWLLRLRGGLLTASLAALTFGAAGYALQGSPGQDGAPAVGNAAREGLPLTEARHAFFGSFSPEESWMSMAEALARSGDTENAVGLLQNAVGKYPTDAQLWIGLGNALVDHAHVLTPPAELAYQRAAELSPGHPAAPFFYGLALARSGQREAAVEVWRRVLVTAPPKASWRPLFEAGIVTLSRPPPAPAR